MGKGYNCNRAARELYAQIKSRQQNVKNLVLTYRPITLWSQLSTFWKGRKSFTTERKTRKCLFQEIA